MKLTSTFYSFIFCYLVIVLNLKGQILNEYQKKVIVKTIGEQFGEIANTYKFQTSYNNIISIKGDTLYNPEGFYYVFKLKNGQIKRLDQSKFHGANFFRTLFSWNNKMYALGGYGMFTTNNNLIYFDPYLKGWSFVETTGDKPNSILGCNFKNGNYIYSFNNFKSGNATSKDVYDHLFYKLNLKSMEWSSFQLEDTSIIIKGQSYYTKNYLIFYGERESILIKPSSFEYMLIKNEPEGIIKNDKIVGIYDDFIEVSSYGSALVDTTIKKIDLNKIWTKSSKIIKKFRFQKKKSYSTILIIISIILITIFIYFGLFKTKKRNQKLKTKTSNYTDLHLKLIGLEKEALSADELDEILEISHLEMDSKKLKRHRIINDLNLNHPNFISRIKDDNDKRRFLYLIKKETD